MFRRDRHGSELTPDYLDRAPPDPRSLAQAYDETSFWSAQFGALLFRHLRLDGARRILDVGCGTGFPALELAFVCGAGTRVVGVDLWKEGLHRAASKVALHGIRSLTLAAADGSALPFRTGSFDLLVSNLGVNNFADRERTVAECARVIRPWGRLVLTTNVQGHLADVYRAFRAVLREQHAVDALERLAEEEHHRVTEAELTTLLARCGMRVRTAVRDAMTLRFRDGSAFLRHPLATWFLERWKLVVESPRRAAVFTALEARLNALARSNRELRLPVPMLYLDAVRDA